MTDAPRSDSPVRKVLLASDLSPRTDRALDRAVQLARDWGAELHIVHAVAPREDFPAHSRLWDAPWRPLEDPRGDAERRLRDDLGGLADSLPLKLHVETGLAGETILRVARSEGAGIILTGVARYDSLQRVVLGDTVDHLVRKSDIPVLVVRGRTHGAYGRVIVATDFSPASAEALDAAVKLFPGSQTSLLHGYHIPFSGILIDDGIRAEFRELGEKAAQNFLASAGLPADFPHIVEQGAPEELLSRHLEENEPALVVVGSHGATALSHILLGSTARKIIDAVRSDVLVVPYSRRGEQAGR